MPIDELRDLRYFVEVARFSSFSAAASHLSVSTGAVSKAIARLEKSMDIALFVRSSRKTRLSPEGEQLFQQAEASFQALERSLDDARRRRDTIAGIVHLSTFTLFGRTRLPALLSKFMAAHPQIEILVSFHDSQRGLSRDAYDIRITWGEKLDEDKVAHILCPIPLIMVGSPDYLASASAPRVPADLEKHQCISGIVPGGARIKWIFTPRNLSGKEREKASTSIMPHGRVTVQDEMGAVRDLARGGLGLTLIDPIDVEHYIADGSLVQLFADYDITTNVPLQSKVIMQYRRRQKLSYAAAALVDFLIDNMPGDDAPLQ